MVHGVLDVEVLQRRGLIVEADPLLHRPFPHLLDVDFLKIEQVGLVTDHHLGIVLRVHVLDYHLPPKLQMLEGFFLGYIVNVDHSQSILKVGGNDRLVVVVGADVPADHLVEALAIGEGPPELAAGQLDADRGVGELGEGAPTESVLDVGLAGATVAHQHYFDLQVCVPALDHTCDYYSYQSGMAQNHDQQEYELIPREDHLRRPLADLPAHNNSRPYAGSILAPAAQQQAPEDQRMREQGETISSMVEERTKIIRMQFENLMEQQREASREMNAILQQIKNIIKAPGVTNSELPQELLQHIQHLHSCNQNSTAKQDTNYHVQIGPEHLQRVIEQKQAQIRGLKQQLLESTRNNINAIFESTLTDSQVLRGQIADLRAELGRQGQAPFKSDCRHEEKIVELIGKYQEMLDLFHSNERAVAELRTRQDENMSCFMAIRADIAHSLANSHKDASSSKMMDLEAKITAIAEALHNAPERVRADSEQDSRVRDLLGQLQELNVRIMQRELQIEKMRDINQELMQRNRQIDKSQLQAEKLLMMQRKIQEKDRRIMHLETTIFQHIDSRAKEDSVSSRDSDLEKHQGTVRNLKVVVSGLKQENASLKQQLKELERRNNQLRNKLNNVTTLQSSRLDIAEKISPDEGCFQLIEDIVNNLVASAQVQDCKCLEKMTELMLSLQSEYPTLEQILFDLGIVQKTSNLIPVEIGQL